MNISLATPNHFSAINHITKTTWLATYPSQTHGITQQDIKNKFNYTPEQLKQKQIRFSKRLQDPNNRIWIAIHHNQPTGFCWASTSPESRINAIYLLPSHQHQGIGSQLLHTAIEWLGQNKPIYLNVASYNQAAINFYQAQGFKITGKQVQDDAATLPSGTIIPETEMVKSPF